jgi:hypothetical protein
MSEVDLPSLVFIDFNIPAITPGRHRVQPNCLLNWINLFCRMCVCRYLVFAACSVRNIGVIDVNICDIHV